MDELNEIFGGRLEDGATIAMTVLLTKKETELLAWWYSSVKKVGKDAMDELLKGKPWEYILTSSEEEITMNEFMLAGFLYKRAVGTLIEHEGELGIIPLEETMKKEVNINE